MKLDIDGYPTTCRYCHQRILKTKGMSQHHYDHRTKTTTSWHTHCTPLRTKEAKP